MTDRTDDRNSPPRRRTFEASGDDVELRQDEGGGTFELRMPIASTGDVRNANDDPLTRDEVDGMARQINDGSLTVGVFVDHGQTTISGTGRYSIAERVGEWQDAEVTTRDGGDAELLAATARMMDPDSLPDIPVRGHLGTVKELAIRDMSVPASIGWADDEDAPGGVDLMEASVVGIQADKRTHSESSASEVVARAAVDAGADPGALVESVVGAGTDRNTIMTDNSDESADEQNAGHEQDEQPGNQRADMSETMDRLVDLQEDQTEMLRTMIERMDDDDGDVDGDEDSGDGGEEDGGEQTAGDPDDEQSAADDDDDDATDDGRFVTVDVDQDAEGLEEEIEELREQLDAVRDGGVTEEDVDMPDADADEATEERDTEENSTENAGEDAVKSLLK